MEQTQREIEDLRAEQNQLVRLLGGDLEPTQAKLGEIIGERERLVSENEKIDGELIELLRQKLPFSLVGDGLVGRVLARLQAEETREGWEEALRHGRDRLSMVLAEIERAVEETFPLATRHKKRRLIERIEAAIGRMWNPPPAGAAENYRHGHCRGLTRQEVVALVRREQAVSREAIKQRLAARENNAARIRELRRQISTIQDRSPKQQEMRERLDKVIEKLNEAYGRQRDIQKFLEAKRPELQARRAEMTQILEKKAKADPLVKRIARANEIATMLGGLAEEGWTLAAKGIAEAMSHAIRRMAHREGHLHRVEIDVHRVETGADFSIKIFSKEGIDISDLDLSAGEKQIFTEALFGAVVELSGQRFPLIVDTPLGRLDHMHRINVLRYLASRDAQVIFLSTDTEIVGPYLDAIRDRIIKTYVLDSEEVGDYRVTRVREGYFEGEKV